MLKIRTMTATSNDYDAIYTMQREIAELHHAGRPDIYRGGGVGYPPEVFSEYLAKEDHFAYIAEEDGQAVGFVFALIKRTKDHPMLRDWAMLYIDDFCVSASARRRGVGKALFAQCRAAAEAAGCNRIELDVMAFNEGAQAFYAELGMEPLRYRMELRLGAEDK